MLSTYGLPPGQHNMIADIDTEKTMADMDEETRWMSSDSVRENASTFGYDPSEHNLGVRVVEAVGAVAGVDETEILTPLNDAIDPEALDSLFVQGIGGRVSFPFIDYHVTVSVSEDGTGQIYIE